MYIQDELQNKSARLRKLTPPTGHAMRGRPCMRCRLRTGKGQRTTIGDMTKNKGGKWTISIAISAKN